MHLTMLIIAGLRSIHRSEVPLGDVTLFTGPNGSGKTAAVGAIVYALTGRFPGVPMTVSGLMSLANSPKEGFRVELQFSDETIVEREMEVDAKGEVHERVIVVHQNKRANGKQAEAAIGKIFGDVQWFVDAFDPERSIWRQSGEKRQTWALNLCAGSSGWSMERLLGEIGNKSEHWNGELSSDPGRCLDRNLANLHDKIVSIQRLVREAKIVADGVTVADEVETIQLRIKAAERGLEDARRRALDTENAIRSVNERQTAIEVARRERRKLDAAAKEARQELQKLLPPAPPRPPEQRLSLGTEGQLIALQLEDEGAFEDWSKAAEEEAQAKEALATAEKDMAALKSSGNCGLCGTSNPDPSKIEERYRVTKERLALAERQTQATFRTREESHDKFITLQFAVDQQKEGDRIYLQELAAFDGKQQNFESTWKTLLRNVQSIEEQLALLPPEKEDLKKPVQLEEELGIWNSEKLRLQAAVDNARASLGVASERAGQLESARKAEDTLKEVKDLFERCCSARGRMLDDAMQPLSTCLRGLDELAPRGGKWDILQHDGTVDVALLIDGAPPLPVTSLSAGEKMRGTIALLIARSMVRREPWTGIFVDNFEQIYPVEERVAVLRSLLMARRTGAVDNVFVAGACDPIADQEGLGLAGLLAYDIHQRPVQR